MSWRWLLELTAVLFLVGCGAPSPGEAPAVGVVAQVQDGDTLTLTDGRKVRLVGIDAPELEKEGQPAEFLAHKAKKILTDLTQGRRVRLEYDRLRYDRFQRLLAYVFLEDGTFVNRELVARGLARVYSQPPNTARQEELLAAQREALEAGRGIWREALKQDEDFYLANRKTLRFHRPGCHLAGEIAPANRLRLTSKKDAYLQGFSPCRTCRP
ncbi:MAG: thermonuclease family protein [Syntrophobacterales bacterium]|nr:thermonuclease family protein [Syntrophobacterales bacterium]